MIIDLSENNSFIYDSCAFSFENIKESFNCLDFGYYDGQFIKLRICRSGNSL